MELLYGWKGETHSDVSDEGANINLAGVNTSLREVTVHFVTSQRAYCLVCLFSRANFM